MITAPVAAMPLDQGYPGRRRLRGSPVDDAVGRRSKVGFEGAGGGLVFDHTDDAGADAVSGTFWEPWDVEVGGLPVSFRSLTVFLAVSG